MIPTDFHICSEGLVYHQPVIFRGWLTVMQCYARLLLAHRGLKKFDLCQSCKATDQLRRINPIPLWQAPPWGPKNGKIRNEQFRCSNYKLINWLNSKNMKSWTTQCPCSRTPSRSVGPLPVAVCSCSYVIVLSPLGLKQSNPMVYQKSEARG
jgi:hypothetical protein